MIYNIDRLNELIEETITKNRDKIESVVRRTFADYKEDERSYLCMEIYIHAYDLNEKEKEESLYNFLHNKNVLYQQLLRWKAEYYNSQIEQYKWILYKKIKGVISDNREIFSKKTSKIVCLNATASNLSISNTEPVVNATWAWGENNRNSPIIQKSNIPSLIEAIKYYLNQHQSATYWKLTSYIWERLTPPFGETISIDNHNSLTEITQETLQGFRTESSCTDQTYELTVVAPIIAEEIREAYSSAENIAVWKEKRPSCLSCNPIHIYTLYNNIIENMEAFFRKNSFNLAGVMNTLSLDRASAERLRECLFSDLRRRLEFCSNEPTRIMILKHL